MITSELKNKIEEIWEIFHAGGIASPMTIIDQITFLFFAKMLDDDELRKEANAAAFDMEVVDPIFDKEHQNCRWHIFCHYEPQLMFDNMTNNVFPLDLLHTFLRKDYIHTCGVITFRLRWITYNDPR